VKKSIVITLLAIAAVTVADFAITEPASAQGRITRLYSRLTQAADIDGVAPAGRVTYRESALGPRNLVIRVRRVNLPAGTRLQVNACDGTVGWVTLEPGKNGLYTAARLRLRVRTGDAVPNCDAGDPITVSGPAVDLSGILTSRR
jgi:hypothetical protein